MSNTQMEIREAPNGEWKFNGYASVVGRPYPMAGYTEIIAPHAFRETLRESPDVRLLVDHSGPVLARTPKTLTLVEDEVGLKVTASLSPNDPEVRALKGRIERGDIREMSFAFTVKPGGQKWDSEFTRREITSVSISGGDVSIVGAGANPFTSVSISERASEMTLEQRRLRAETIGQELRAATPNVGLGDERRNAMLDHEADQKLAAARAKMDRFRATSPLVKDGDNFDRIKRSWQAKIAEVRGESAQRSADATYERRLADERAAVDREARELGIPNWRGFGGTKDSFGDAIADNTADGPDDDRITTTCPECGASLVIELPPDNDDGPQETSTEDAGPTGDGVPYFSPSVTGD
jgi:HK97 family phage prohead protease